METKPGVIRKRVLAALRTALGIGILFWLFLRMPRAELQEVLVESVEKWPLWLAGITATLFGLLTGSLRWHCILRTRGFDITLRRTTRIFFVGQFFNSFLLGACGGDLARAYYAAKAHPERRTGAVLSVLVDRAVGLFVFVVFSCIMIFARGRFFLDHKATLIPGMLMAGFLIGGILSLFVLFRHNLFEKSPLFARLENWTRLGPLLRKAYDILFFYRAHKQLMLISLLLSVLNLSFLTLAVYFFALSLQIDVSLLDHFTLFPVITVLTAIPITPGALGIREGLFAHMYAVVGAASFATVPLSILIYFDGVLWSIFGGFIFLTYAPAERSALREELKDIQAESAVVEEVLKNETVSLDGD